MPDTQTKRKKQFPLIALLIAIIPFLSLGFFMINFRLTLWIVTILSVIFFAWVIMMMAKKIIFAVMGKKENKIKNWEQQVTTGATWYFIAFVACLMMVAFLHGLFAG